MPYRAARSLLKPGAALRHSVLCLLRIRPEPLQASHAEFALSSAATAELLCPGKCRRKIGRVAHVRPTCPGVPWGVNGRKKMGDPDFLPRGATNTRVCGPGQPGLHEVRQRHHVRQEIRGKPYDRFFHPTRDCWHNRTLGPHPRKRLKHSRFSTLFAVLFGKTLEPQLALFRFIA